MKIFNGDGMILGRLCSQAAKAALLGEEVKVVNCEKIVISGKPFQAVEYEQQRRRRKGYPLKSQARSRLPHLYVRRAIRGMLPWKVTRGKTAYRRILCYAGLPPEFGQQPLISHEPSSFQKLPNLKYITVGDLCGRLRGKA